MTSETPDTPSTPEWEHPDLGVMTWGEAPPTPAQRVMGALIVIGAVVLGAWTVITLVWGPQ